MKTSGCIHDGWLVLKQTNKKVFETEFLYFLLSSPYVFQQFNYLAAGSTVRNLNIALVSSVEVPTPPLPEQKRIVAILDEAFKSIAKAKESAEKNLKNAKELFESYLQSVFENLREDCPSEKLGHLCTFVRGPFGGSLKKSYFKPTGFAVYEQQHAINDQFENIRYFIDETKFKEMKRFELKEGDLIMSCSGTMGKIAIVPKNIPRGIINQALLKLTPHDQLEINFLKIWMESQDFQNQLSKFSKGAAIKNVASVKSLKDINAPIPNLKKQREIFKKIEVFNIKTKKLESIYNQKLTDLEELKQSILHKVFKGELSEV